MKSDVRRRLEWTCARRSAGPDFVRRDWLAWKAKSRETKLVDKSSRYWSTCVRSPLDRNFDWAADLGVWAVSGRRSSGTNGRWLDGGLNWWNYWSCTAGLCCRRISLRTISLGRSFLIGFESAGRLMMRFRWAEALGDWQLWRLKNAISCGLFLVNNSDLVSVTLASP